MKKLFYYLPAITWTILILILCLMPGHDVPKISFLDKIHFDKVVHAGLFGGFVFLWCWAFFKKPLMPFPQYLLFFTIIAIIFGVSIEYLQKYWADQRDYDVLDMVADSVGAIIAALFFYYLIIKRKFKERLIN